MMCGLLLWALLLCGLCVLPGAESEASQFHFVNESLTWPEAQQFCRQYNSNLAIVRDKDDLRRLPRPMGYRGNVWVGLYDDPTDLSTWAWSVNNSTPSYTNWSQDHPKFFYTKDQCAQITNEGWTNYPCSSASRALCFSGSSPRVFHVMNKELNWYEAKKACRTNYTDLAFVDSDDDSLPVLGRGEKLWIGLRRFAYRWTDNTYAKFHKMRWSFNSLPPQIHCAAECPDRKWNMFGCENKYPFYCNDELTTEKQFVTIQLSGPDLSDPTIFAQVSDKIHKRLIEEGLANHTVKWMTPPKKIPGHVEKKEPTHDTQQCKYKHFEH